MNPNPDSRPISPRAEPSPRALGFLFGALALGFGLGDPFDGLIAQPVRSMLRSWGRSDSEITDFGAALAIPWAVKPLYGLLSDFVPLWGSRRRSYLVLTIGLSALGFGSVLMLPVAPRSSMVWLAALLVPTVGLAFADVVADALLIDVSRHRGLTGRLQSIQWGCLYAASIASGWIGGYLSEYRMERIALMAVTFLFFGLWLLCWARVRDQKHDPGASRSSARDVMRSLAGTKGLMAVAAFLFLWNFNPLSPDVLYLHMTGALGLGEQFYGLTHSVLSATCLVASFGYGWFAPRFSMRTRVRASVVLGVLATLAYVGLGGQTSALLATVAVGLTYMTATLIQLELAARICPPEAAGTLFATLMAIENIATTSSSWVGGRLYAWGSGIWGAEGSFLALVIVGAATTAGCGLLLPLLPREPGAIVKPKRESEA